MEQGKYTVIDVETWEEFLKVLQDIKMVRNSYEKGTNYVSSLLYRGQSKSDWKLNTTLERFQGKDKNNIRDYYRKIWIASDEIEAFTGRRWNFPSDDYYLEFNKKLDVMSPHYVLFQADYDLAEYYVYLRHHGFPSPLLDWTRSPFIAAYFSFCENIPDSQFASIFIFLEFMGAGKSMSGHTPTIHTLGPSIKGHERHFLQQCEYTFCLQRDSEGEPLFTNHEAAYIQPTPFQNNLWKINIPRNQRFKVLHFLDSVNINAFSLFGSIESLMTTMAERHFFLGDKPQKHYKL